VQFGAAVLAAVLDRDVPVGARGLVVGLSGGPDSACLLTAVKEAAATRASFWPVRAVHVDHGLQAASDALAASAARLCRHLEVPLALASVEVETGRGVSLEAAARAARYRAFERALEPDECLLTAHHAKDQAETLLLQLLRGAGLKGLSAMPPCRRFGKGWHVRPLIDITPEALASYRAARGVEALEDPMNRDVRFDRVYLRARVWPALEARWPGAALALTRTAHHLADAQTLLDHRAADTMRRLRDGEALLVAGLRALGARERLSVLRHWLNDFGVTPPSTRKLTEAVRQVMTADSDHLPEIVWGEHALRRYQARLFVTSAAVPALGAPQEWRIAPGARLELGEGLGTLRWTEQRGGLDGARLPEILCVRRRSGGETLKVGTRARTQSVQHLCQAMGVLPWMRDALPMLYAHDALIAIGDIWQDARWRVAPDVPGFGCVWEEAPTLT
jgi:tRNA(Ile)-lysidine synthase